MTYWVGTAVVILVIFVILASHIAAVRIVSIVFPVLRDSSVPLVVLVLLGVACGHLSLLACRGGSTCLASAMVGWGFLLGYVWLVRVLCSCT